MRNKFILVTAAAVLLASTVTAVSLVARSSYRTAGAAVSPAAEPRKQLWTCGMHPQVIQDHPGNCPICHMKLTPLNGGEPDETAGGPGVRIDPAVVQNMGVRTAAVDRGPLTVTVRAVGVLAVPEPAMTDVTLRVGGFIEKLYADTDGMSVARGQVLFDLYSPDVQVAEQELIGAVQASKSQDASAPAGARADAGGLVELARRKLQLWGVADGDIDAAAAADRPPRTVPFRSPAGGHVMDKAVVAGSAVQAGQRLMRIEDHSVLWLDAQVYEDQIEAVRVGQTVRATVDGLPGRTFTGTVTFVYPHVDPMTRTETVRANLDNPDHELRPGMYATAEVVTRPVADAILVPREAVIDTGTRQVAFVADPALPGHFEPRDVRVGVSGDGDRLQVVQGLAPGERVVTSGQFLMDVESRTTEAIEKLRGTDRGAPPHAR